MGKKKNKQSAPADGLEETLARHWVVVMATVLVVAALFRFWAIDIKPAHFDEGINGWFADGMKTTGFYRYDPENYHGPFHFYMVYVSQALFGRSLFALRLPAILASIGCVAAIFLLRRYFGRTAVLVAATLQALSPAFVFYGRYSIHESWLVLFNILFFAGVLGLWKQKRPADLFLCVAGLAGMILNKETWLIQVGCLLLAVPCLWLWNRVVPVVPPANPPSRSWKIRHLAWAVGLGVLAIVFFFSGTFLHWDGLRAFWQAYFEWVDTGVKTGGHEKTNYDLFLGLNWYWVALFLRYEWPAVLGLLACIGCMAKVRDTLRLTAIYACGVLLAYSVIPYKTPWCIIAFLWIFQLIAGGILAEIPRRFRMVAFGLLAVAALFSTWKTLDLNFRKFTDPSEPYVYVQTFRETERFTRPLLDLADADPQNSALRGEILAGSYFPLPWILGDFPNVAWWGADRWPDVLDGDFLLVDSARKDEALERTQAEFWEIEFRLRDGQEPLTGLFRKSVFPAEAIALPAK